jgi:FKBP-type peptidyl-prolyl cis-trans isomerase FklB
MGTVARCHLTAAGVTVTGPRTQVDAAKKKKKKAGGHDVEADAKWLAEKSKEEGVVALESGLAYKVLKSGKAWAKSPMAHTSCTCKYKGTLTPVNGGKQFDAGEIDFAPNQVIKGWTEAMQLMKEGDEWELYIPSDLAYGSAGAGADIPGGAALVFTMEIKKVHGKKTGKDFKRFEPIPEEFKKKKAGAAKEAEPKTEL